MNEQQYRDTVRAQLESELEALEAQIKLLENERSGAPAESPRASAHVNVTPTTRRLTPPRNEVSYETANPRVSLQPARAVAKPQEELPEAIQALMRMKSAGSRESAINLTIPSPPATAPEQTDRETREPQERSPQARPMSMQMQPTTSSEKDDVLGYYKMTYRGIKKHISMLDRTKLEQYLSEDEFTRVLGANRTEFAALPKWKQERLKRERGLL